MVGLLTIWMSLSFMLLFFLYVIYRLSEIKYYNYLIKLRIQIICERALDENIAIEEDEVAFRYDYDDYQETRAEMLASSLADIDKKIAECEQDRLIKIYLQWQILLIRLNLKFRGGWK